MKMDAPGYIGGQSKGTDGLWVTEPNSLAGTMRLYWDEGLDIHIHSNGDAAQDSTLKAFSEMKAGEDGQRLSPSPQLFAQVFAQLFIQMRRSPRRNP